MVWVAVICNIVEKLDSFVAEEKEMFTEGVVFNKQTIREALLHKSLFVNYNWIFYFLIQSKVQSVCVLNVKVHSLKKDYWKLL